MAGRFGGFDKQSFVEGIHFAMKMGAPIDVDSQATFYGVTALHYQLGQENNHDSEGVPFDPSIPVTRFVPEGIRVPCAIEYTDAEDQPTDFGNVTPSKAKITLLDEDYQQVKECAYVVLGGEKYLYRHTEAPLGLFDVGVYTMIFVAEDQN